MQLRESRLWNVAKSTRRIPSRMGIRTSNSKDAQINVRWLRNMMGNWLDLPHSTIPVEDISLADVQGSDPRSLAPLSDWCKRIAISKGVLANKFASSLADLWRAGPVLRAPGGLGNKAAMGRLNPVSMIAAVLGISWAVLDQTYQEEVRRSW